MAGLLTMTRDDDNEDCWEDFGVARLSSDGSEMNEAADDGDTGGSATSSVPPEGTEEGVGMDGGFVATTDAGAGSAGLGAGGAGED